MITAFAMIAIDCIISVKLQVSFAEHSLFYRALLLSSVIILRTEETIDNVVTGW